MRRDDILRDVRSALRRTVGQPAGTVPAARLRLQPADAEARVRQFCAAVESLAGKAHRAASCAEASAYTSKLLAGGTAVASNAPFLNTCGITSLPGVRTGRFEEAQLRSLCAGADLGITGADYALADTGTLVMLSSAEEARMISLLPPVHLAILPSDRILTGLDELFSILPYPAEKTSSMVLITGPSRTADIEQILILKVHGPGEVHVVVVKS
jgi:L-lactate utilization protein LutC